MFTFFTSNNVHYFTTEDTAYKLEAEREVYTYSWSLVNACTCRKEHAFKEVLLNLTAIPHLNGQVTQFPKILKSKQVLKRSQVKSGIDSIGLQTQSLLSVLHAFGYIISNPTVHMNYEHNNTKLREAELWILKLMSSKVQTNELKIVSRVLQPNFSAWKEIWEALQVFADSLWMDH